jgi:hypothetical protein
MSQAASLKALARRAYLSYHQDGIIDLLLGWLAFAFGLRLLFDSVAFALLAWLPILSYVPLKNSLTVPRLGYVKFGADYGQKARLHLGFTIAGLLVGLVALVGLLLLAGSPALAPLRGHGLLIYGAAVTLLLLAAGLVSGLWRLALYGLLGALLAAAGMQAGLPEHLFFIALGLVILLVGGTLLLRFIRKYPLAAKENDQ